jgi:anti-sigma factor RsiW
MGRPFDKHIDAQELDALVPSRAHQGEGSKTARLGSMREAERHLASCAECRRKVAQYLQVVDRMNVGVSVTSAAQPDCPADVDWHEVAAGLWPELRTHQLITHAARCAHCGPLLRAASAEEPTPQEEAFLAQLKAPTRPALQVTKELVPANHQSSIWRRFLDWKVLVPASALLVLVAVLSTGRASSSPLSGTELAQFAANTHKKHLQGNLALELHSDSQSQLNEWLHEKSQFSLALPASSEVPREQLPYRIEGARLIRVGNNTAAYIAYQMEADAVSLIVTPLSVAVASGGSEVDFKKVSFHYYTSQGYKVVTWSVHGLTYALVSGEGNNMQRSCMVCHSTMRDPDLSHTPTPLADQNGIAGPASH